MAQFASDRSCVASFDPVTAYSSPITQFHRYRYANNNPYSFTDPDGRCGSRIEGNSAPNCTTILVNPSDGGSGDRASSGSARTDDVTENYNQNTFRYGQGGAERLEEAGKYAAKEAGQFFAFAKVAKWLSGLGRFLGKGGRDTNWVFGAGKSEARWAGQMERRGWTPRQITEAVSKGKSFPAENFVNKGNSATRYMHPETGRSVVIDDVTREVIHVGGNGYKY